MWNKIVLIFILLHKAFTNDDPASSADDAASVFSHYESVIYTYGAVRDYFHLTDVMYETLNIGVLKGCFNVGVASTCRTAKIEWFPSTISYLKNEYENILYLQKHLNMSKTNLINSHITYVDYFNSPTTIIPAQKYQNHFQPALCSLMILSSFHDNWYSRFYQNRYNYVLSNDRVLNFLKKVISSMKIFNSVGRNINLFNIRIMRRRRFDNDRSFRFTDYLISCKVGQTLPFPLLLDYVGPSGAPIKGIFYLANGVLAGKPATIQHDFQTLYYLVCSIYGEPPWVRETTPEYHHPKVAQSLASEIVRLRSVYNDDRVIDYYVNKVRSWSEPASLLIKTIRANFETGDYDAVVTVCEDLLEQAKSTMATLMKRKRDEYEDEDQEY